VLIKGFLEKLSVVVLAPMKTLLCILTFLLACKVYGHQNITVDDTDYSMIDYEGAWSPNSYQQSNLDYNGSHTVSVDGSAVATFTFTGIAVSYLSPRWPFAISVSISIDDGTNDLVDLTDPSDSSEPNTSEETVQSAVVWQKLQLTNDIHIVTVSMGPYGGFVVVDGFIYTVLETVTTTPPPPPPSSPASTSASTSSPTTAATTTSSLPPSGPSNSLFPLSPQSNSAATGTSSNTAAVATVSNQKSRGTKNPIPIAGGIAGGTAGIALVLCVIVAVMIRSRSPTLSDYWPRQNTWRDLTRGSF